MIKYAMADFTDGAYQQKTGYDSDLNHVVASCIGKSDSDVIIEIKGKKFKPVYRWCLNKAKWQLIQ